MTGLIILLILFPIVLLILLISIHTRTAEQQRDLDSVNRTLGKIEEALGQLTEAIRKGGIATTTPVIPPPKAAEPQPEPIKEPEPVLPIPKPIYTPPKPIVKEKEVSPVLDEIDDKMFKESLSKVAPKAARKGNKDLEKFIGENLANKIGIAVLVLGISFFVKYAIDKNWINETGRVAIGLACGSLLIGIAHYIRKNYRSFSSVLIGGGISVFYFTIAYAFHQYQLISQSVAFASMTVITAFAVVLSIIYNRLELAIIATLGGFLTPFLVSTGQENHTALFTYLSILCTGLMALAWFRRWPIINFIALFFTVIIYGSWLTKRLYFQDGVGFPYKDAFLFASIFYVLFIIMNIINNLRLRKPFAALDFITVLSVNLLYILAGCLCLSYNHSGKGQGLFVAIVGAINLLAAYFFNIKKSIDRHFILLLTGIGISFLTLAVPIAFESNFIVLAWAVESVLLLVLFQRTRLKLLFNASLVVYVLLVVSMVIHWNNIYLGNSNTLPVIINKGFLTSLVATIAAFVYYLRFRKEDSSQVLAIDTNFKDLKAVFLIVAILFVYISGVLEIWHQFKTRLPGSLVYTIYLQLYTYAISFVLIYWFRKSSYSTLLRFILTAICLAFYIRTITLNQEVAESLLTHGHTYLFFGHWVGAILMAWLLISFTRRFLQPFETKWENYRVPFTWFSVAGLVILFSAEVFEVIRWIAYPLKSEWEWWKNLYNKAGLSILWGLCSFLLMWIGMKDNHRVLRLISLSLFTITLGKLFLYDIRNIPPGGKIAAFILLGVLLLTVSFMYQRLKKMLLEKDDTDPGNPL